MDILQNRFKLIFLTFWNEKDQSSAIDIRKDTHTGPYRFGKVSVFIPHTNVF